MKNRFLIAKKILLIIIGIITASVFAVVGVFLIKYNSVVIRPDDSDLIQDATDPSGAVTDWTPDDTGVHVDVLSGDADISLFGCRILKYGAKFDYVSGMTDSQFYIYDTGLFKNDEEIIPAKSSFMLYIFARKGIKENSYFVYKLNSDNSVSALEAGFDSKTNEISVRLESFGYIIVSDKKLEIMLTPTPVEPTPTSVEPIPTSVEPTPTPVNPTPTPSTEDDLPFTTPDFESSGVKNILIIGIDARQNVFKGLSDVIMIMSVNTNTNKITLTSVMRDLRVEIPGKGISTKINFAYANGGAKLLMRTIQRHFGIPIDHWVVVNFHGATEIVEMLGGVDMKITDWEARYMYDSSIRKGGQYHFNGAQTLAYMRLRGDGNDYYRTGRQGKVLTYLFNKYKSSSISDIIKITYKAFDYIKTDMTIDVLVSVLTDIYDCRDNGLNHATYPFGVDGRSSIKDSSDIKEKSYPDQINKLYDRLYGFKPEWE